MAEKPIKNIFGIADATSAIGGSVCDPTWQGRHQRVIVRDARRAPDLPGARVVESSIQVSKPCARLWLMYKLFHGLGQRGSDRVHPHIAAVDEAVEAGVERIV